MNCKICGYRINPGATKCDNCGESVFDDALPRVGGSARDEALSVLKSPLYLALGIAWAANLVWSIISFFWIVGETKLPYFTDGITMGILFLVFVIFLLPTLLGTIGFLMSAIKARSGECGGLGVVKSSYIISMIFFSFIVILTAIGLVSLLIQLFGNSSGQLEFYGMKISAGAAEVWLSVALVIAFAVMMFIFYAKVLSTISIVQTAVDTDKCSCQTSAFAVVMCFVQAIIPLFVAVYAMTQGSSSAIVNGISLLLSSGCTALFGIVLVSFRKIEVSVGEGKSYERVPIVGGYGATPISEFGEAAVRYCDYCGRELYGSELCSCGGGNKESMSGYYNGVPEPTMALPTERFGEPGRTSVGTASYYGGAYGKVDAGTPKERIPSADAPKVVENKHFCIDCGKVLYGSEVCSCKMRKPEPAKPVLNPESVSGGLRSTMRAPRKPMEMRSPSLPKESEEAKSPERNFFGSAGDLD